MSAPAPGGERVLHPALRSYLERFEAAVLTDPAVLGALFTGSIGRGTADRFSDLDFEVWLTDDASTDLPAKTRDLLSVLGPIQILNFLDQRFARALVGRDWRRVDLHLRHRNDTDPRLDFVGARVVKDFDGVLTALVAASHPEDVMPTREQARAEIMAAIDTQIYVAAYNARGATLCAAQEVTFYLAMIYDMLARLRGRRSYGFRYAEQLLTPAELALLAVAWPAAPVQGEVRRAARAMWVWSRHVWDEAERTLGASLDLTIDEAALLAAVDAFYDE